MIAQCLYQSDPKNLASMGRQRLACQRAARKLQWGVQKERISETNEPVPLLMRPAVKEILQDAEQHRSDRPADRVHVLLLDRQRDVGTDSGQLDALVRHRDRFGRDDEKPTLRARLQGLDEASEERRQVQYGYRMPGDRPTRRRLDEGQHVHPGGRHEPARLLPSFHERGRVLLQFVGQDPREIPGCVALRGGSERAEPPLRLVWERQQVVA